MKSKMRTLAHLGLALVVAGACLSALDMNVHACSRALWKAEGQPVLVGRNMDWTEKMGTKLYVFPKGIGHEGLVDENPLKWTSKYGSVVTTVWDCATVDGINDAGLNANLLYLAETKYGERDPARDFCGVHFALGPNDGPVDWSPGYHRAAAKMLAGG